nr:MAG TPA: hypothetical protein [Crassvirales sp.]
MNHPHLQEHHFHRLLASIVYLIENRFQEPIIVYLSSIQLYPSYSRQIIEQTFFEIGLSLQIYDYLLVLL